MIERIKQFFSENIQTKTSQNSKQALELACAALMFEVSRIDQSVDESEVQTIRRILSQEFSIEPDILQNLLDLAFEESKDSTSVYQFTSLINEQFDESQKFKIILNLWQVAFADGNADKYEEHLIRRIAELIYLPHLKYIEAKHIAKNQAKDQ